MAVGYHNMGNFCLETGEASRAEEYYQKMIREVQSVRARFPEFTCGLVIAWNNLGDGALAEAQIARAEWYYLKGLAEARKMGKDSGGLKGLSLSFDRMGDLRKAQGKWEEALNYYEEALKTDQQLCEEAETTEKEAITETRALALSRGKLGDCYLEMGQEEEANRHYKEASRLCRQISQETADTINETRRTGGRVICVGTTSCRTIESFAAEDGTLTGRSGWTNIFIYPGYQFKVLDALITNFHLPQSTLLMLVSALAGREHILAAYEEAVREKYRFFSFGDAMLIADLRDAGLPRRRA